MSAVCIIAYASYFTDARPNNYVGALLKQAHKVHVYGL